MKSNRDVADRLRNLHGHESTFLLLIESCRDRGDLHGVVDACNDLRVIQAEIAALEWVMA